MKPSMFGVTIGVAYTITVSYVISLIVKGLYG